MRSHTPHNTHARTQHLPPQSNPQLQTHHRPAPGSMCPWRCWPAAAPNNNRTAAAALGGGGSVGAGWAAVAASARRGRRPVGRRRRGRRRSAWVGGVLSVGVCARAWTSHTLNPNDLHTPIPHGRTFNGQYWPGQIQDVGKQGGSGNTTTAVKVKLLASGEEGGGSGGCVC